MKIITGSGRSGTSFVAQIIDKLDALTGEMEWNDQVRAGMESKEIVDMNKMLFFLNGKEAPYSNQWLSRQEMEKAAYMAKTILHTIAKQYDGKWAKDPLFSKTLQIWLDCKTNVEIVVICTRQPLKSMQSARRTNRGFEPAAAFSESQIETEMHARQGYLWDTILRYGIPYVVVRYEHMQKDLQRVLEKLFPDKAPKDIQELIDKDWKPQT